MSWGWDEVEKIMLPLNYTIFYYIIDGYVLVSYYETLGFSRSIKIIIVKNYDYKLQVIY